MRFSSELVDRHYSLTFLLLEKVRIISSGIIMQLQFYTSMKTDCTYMKMVVAGRGAIDFEGMGWFSLHYSILKKS